jgi:hypothetical protein
MRCRLLAALLGAALAVFSGAARADCPPQYLSQSGAISSSTCGPVVFNGTQSATLVLPAIAWQGRIINIGSATATVVGDAGALVNGSTAGAPVSAASGAAVSGDPSAGWWLIAGGSVPTCSGGQFVDGPGSCATPSAAGGTRVEVTETANYSVTSGDAGSDFNNAGAAGGITFTLPAWSAGLNYCFTNTAGQTVTVQAASGNFITEAGVSSAAGGTAASTMQYSSVCIVAMTSAIWQVDRHIGGWTLT